VAAPRYHLAYVFERFPSFTQTFCAREVAQLRRSGVRPLVFSVRDPSGESCPCPVADEVRDLVHLLPQGKALTAQVEALKRGDLLPQRAVLTLRHWGDRPDKQRVYEGAYIGYHMAQAGVRHAHAHFAGVAARACWWTRFFYGTSYSFTGHANDLFCTPDEAAVGLDELVAGAASVVTVSDFTARWLREKFPRYAAKFARVYNGLDLAPFERVAGRRFADPPLPSPASPGPPAPLVLSVGRLIEKKGFPDLIDACAKLRDSGLQLRCRIIGDGPLATALADRIARHRLGDTVELAGPMSVDGVKDQLAAADIFALACTTEHDGGMDNLPTVIMEAMAAGLPCVSTRLAGVPEMVADGESGVLTPPGDVPALADALHRLATDPVLRATMGRAGLARARREFDQSATARHLLLTLAGRGGIAYDPALCRTVTGLRIRYLAQVHHRLRAALDRRRRWQSTAIPPEARRK
jgi:glycosyltransferase involved in cell wall biosynthesis